MLLDQNIIEWGNASSHFSSTALLYFQLVLLTVLLKSVDFKEPYEIALDIKKPELLMFKGLSGSFRFVINLNVVLAAGLEPATPCMSCKYSNQLS